MEEKSDYLGGAEISKTLLIIESITLLKIRFDACVLNRKFGEGITLAIDTKL